MAEVDEQEAILRRPSFSFAKRHGLIVGAQLDDGVELIARQDVSLQATAEMRRFLDQPIQLRMVSAGEFDRLLQQAYENKSGSSMQMVEGFDDDSLDLSSAAEALSEPQDLLPFFSPYFSQLKCRWAVCAFGSQEAQCLTAGALLGGDVRVGFENNHLTLSGQPAISNAEQVASMRQILHSLNIQTLDAEGLRQQLVS